MVFASWFLAMFVVTADTNMFLPYWIGTHFGYSIVQNDCSSL